MCGYPRRDSNPRRGADPASKTRFSAILWGEMVVSCGAFRPDFGRVGVGQVRRRAASRRRPCDLASMVGDPCRGGGGSPTPRGVARRGRGRGRGRGRRATVAASVKGSGPKIFQRPAVCETGGLRWAIEGPEKSRRGTPRLAGDRPPDRKSRPRAMQEGFGGATRAWKVGDPFSPSPNSVRHRRSSRCRVGRRRECSGEPTGVGQVRSQQTCVAAQFPVPRRASAEGVGRTYTLAYTGSRPASVPGAARRGGGGRGENLRPPHGRGAVEVAARVEMTGGRPVTRTAAVDGAVGSEFAASISTSAGLWGVPYRGFFAPSRGRAESWSRSRSRRGSSRAGPGDGSGDGSPPPWRCGSGVSRPRPPPRPRRRPAPVDPASARRSARRPAPRPEFGVVEASRPVEPSRSRPRKARVRLGQGPGPSAGSTRHAPRIRGVGSGGVKSCGSWSTASRRRPGRRPRPSSWRGGGRSAVPAGRLPARASEPCGDPTSTSSRTPPRPPRGDPRVEAPCGPVSGGGGSSAGSASPTRRRGRVGGVAGRWRVRACGASDGSGGGSGCPPPTPPEFVAPSGRPRRGRRVAVLGADGDPFPAPGVARRECGRGRGRDRGRRLPVGGPPPRGAGRGGGRRPARATVGVGVDVEVFVGAGGRSRGRGTPGRPDAPSPVGGRDHPRQGTTDAGSPGRDRAGRPHDRRPRSGRRGRARRWASASAGVRRDVCDRGSL